MKIRGCDLDAAVEQGKQIVGDNAFDAIIVTKFQAYPKSLQLWPGQKNFALRFKIVGELSHEINAADILDCNHAMLAFAGQQVERFNISHFSGIEVTAHRSSIEK